LDEGSSTGSLRLHGYRAALADAGLRDDGLVVPTRRLLRHHGVKAAERLLAAPAARRGVLSATCWRSA
jgi:LacI family repressor for deo operon, udp, cdd, tsx, nupC, and nupG